MRDSVARTHNRAIRKEALRIASPGDGRTRSDLEQELDRFGRSRMRQRAEPIAVTESYGPHADAILSFFRDAGVEPEFSFGGHPDDAEPVCAICQAIIAANPHSLRGRAADRSPASELPPVLASAGLGGRAAPHRRRWARLSAASSASRC